MSTMITDSSNYSAIASALREKNGETTKYRPSEMAAAISNLSSLTNADGTQKYPDGEWWDEEELYKDLRPTTWMAVPSARAKVEETQIAYCFYIYMQSDTEEGQFTVGFSAKGWTAKTGYTGEDGLFVAENELELVTNTLTTFPVQCYYNEELGKYEVIIELTLETPNSILVDLIYASKAATYAGNENILEIDFCALDPAAIDSTLRSIDLGFFASNLVFLNWDVVNIVENDPFNSAISILQTSSLTTLLLVRCSRFFSGFTSGSSGWGFRSTTTCLSMGKDPIPSRYVNISISTSSSDGGCARQGYITYVYHPTSTTATSDQGNWFKFIGMFQLTKIFIEPYLTGNTGTIASTSAYTLQAQKYFPGYCSGMNLSHANFADYTTSALTITIYSTLGKGVRETILNHYRAHREAGFTTTFTYKIYYLSSTAFEMPDGYEEWQKEMDSLSGSYVLSFVLG